MGGVDRADSAVAAADVVLPLFGENGQEFPRGRKGPGFETHRARDSLISRAVGGPFRGALNEPISGPMVDPGGAVNQRWARSNGRRAANGADSGSFECIFLWIKLLLERI
jgi:hypothetical protein